MVKKFPKIEKLRNHCGYGRLLNFERRAKRAEEGRRELE